MKLKAAISNTAPNALVRAFGDREFVTRFLTEVVGEILGAQSPLARPAEYYVQEPDRTIGIADCWGVELRLTGVSRNGRKAGQFHKALAKLQEIATALIQTVLAQQHDAPESRVQLFSVLMLDGDVETKPGSGVYSSVLETEAVWVTKPSS